MTLDSSRYCGLAEERERRVNDTGKRLMEKMIKDKSKKDIG
jgi:hypothetical protein